MAADMDIVQKLQSEMTCGTCSTYFPQPVTMNCGHSFCLECLSWSWRAGAKPFSCPECRQVSQIRELSALNLSLENLTDTGKQLGSHNLQSTEGQSLQSSEGQRQCPTHKEDFKFFCEEDQTLLCMYCCQMPEHGTHNLSPVEEAAHNYRRKIQEILSHLGKDFEEAEKLRSQEDEMERPFVDWACMISGEYRKLQHFLVAEESHYLERLKEEQRTSKDRLSQHIHTLQVIMEELEESSHKFNIDLLQDFKELLGKSESVSWQSPKAFSTELRQYPITGMLDILNKFKVDIRLHPESDCQSDYVTVSEDLKTMRAGESWQVDLNKPEDSICHYVFAEQFFTSGSHYWEVDVMQLPQWILGIYTPFLSIRMGRNSHSCASVFLLRCVKKEDHYNFQTYPGSLDHQVKDPVSRVGVYLEYSLGSVLFYNVLQRSVIYRFCPIPFTGPVRPVFSPGPPLPGTKPGPMTICPADSHLCTCCCSFS
ncbi:tripartite motif-containing protein 64-like [Notamacropus eugenii]|uniref:tripartite motif-containing protein 64-like n=1 Tax=Notamacropus eugenii TaxID=9315 RepID=UPI003B67FB1C